MGKERDTEDNWEQHLLKDTQHLKTNEISMKQKTIEPFFIIKTLDYLLHSCATLCQRSELTAIFFTIFHKYMNLMLLYFVIVDIIVFNVILRVIMTGWTHNVPFLEMSHGTGYSNERIRWISSETQYVFFKKNICLWWFIIQCLSIKINAGNCNKKSFWILSERQYVFLYKKFISWCNIPWK